MVQLSHPYTTARKTTALPRQTLLPLLFNMLSRLVITFLPRSKHLLISWLQSPSAVLEENIGRTLFDINPTRSSLTHLLENGNKSKNKQMGPKQT